MVHPGIIAQAEAFDQEALDRQWFERTLVEAFISAIGTGVGLAFGAWVASRFFGLKG